MATTTNYGWTTPDDTALVKDGAAAIRTLGSSVDTTTKALNPSTTLGDIEYRSATANTNTRLAIGSTGNVLTVSGGVPTWAAPAGGGKLLQMVTATYATYTRNSTSTYADTGLTATITPSASTSKVMILMYQQIAKSANASDNRIGIKLLRGSTQINENVDLARTDYAGETVQGYTLTFVDSPATTSATTYKTQFKNIVNGPIADMYNTANGPAQMILLEIGA